MNKINFNKGGPQNNTFKHSKSIEITTNPKTLYIDDVKITTNNKKKPKKLFYLLKKNKIIYSSDSDSHSTEINDNTTTTKAGFSLNYLGKIQRKRIEDHLAEDKTLQCHHKNCYSFNGQRGFLSVYDYNIHCHSSHQTQPLHPELPLIEMLNLEPRDNPWEEVVKNDTYLPLNNRTIEEVEDYYDYDNNDENEGGLEEYI
ncbi:MAG: hypothetical protein ACR2F1_12075 [Nitrososphaeraceae archaeon]